MIRNLRDPTISRTIVSATDPWRFADSYVEIILKVWFEELSEPVAVIATPFDEERHVKELWIRAMSGEYGNVQVFPERLDHRRPIIIVTPDDVCHLILMDPETQTLGSTRSSTSMLPAYSQKHLKFVGSQDVQS